jgi:hypothetical protein
MAKPKMRKEELSCKLARLETELRHAQKLLEARAKANLWQRFWGLIGAKAVLVALVLAFMAMASGVWGFEVGAYFRGNMYLKQSEAVQLGYVSGVVDAFHLAKNTQEKEPLGAPAANAMFVNCTRGLPNYQVKAIVNKYLKDHPENWDLAMADIVYGAVIDAGKKRGTIR